MAKTNLNVLGIMSGTSLGSVDYCICTIGERVRLKALWTVRYPAQLQDPLDAAAQGTLLSHELCQLHHDLGRFYARHAARAVGEVQVVGMHGQTIFHSPHRSRPATYQLGEPAYLVEALQVPVVSNFRAADIAAGGQGAPLATLFHQAVFGQRGSHICVNNLGGISNVTSIDWTSGKEASVLSFDTGPANKLMDLAVQHFSKGTKIFDSGGAWARRGTLLESLLRSWLKNSYFKKEPPKSTGRELFGESFLKNVFAQKPPFRSEDVIRTLSELTAVSLAESYRRFLPGPPQEVILTGGGAANLFLVERIRQQLHAWNSSIHVRVSEEKGWPKDAVEPAAFALLAYYRWRGWPANIPNTTGARKAVLLGAVSEPGRQGSGKKTKPRDL